MIIEINQKKSFYFYLSILEMKIENCQFICLFYSISITSLFRLLIKKIRFFTISFFFDDFSVLKNGDKRRTFYSFLQLRIINIK